MKRVLLLFALVPCVGAAAEDPFAPEPLRLEQAPPPPILLVPTDSKRLPFRRFFEPDRVYLFGKPVHREAKKQEALREEFEAFMNPAPYRPLDAPGPGYRAIRR